MLSLHVMSTFDDSLEVCDLLADSDNKNTSADEPKRLKISDITIKKLKKRFKRILPPKNSDDSDESEPELKRKTRKLPSSSEDEDEDDVCSTERSTTGSEDSPNSIVPENSSTDGSEIENSSTSEEDTQRWRFPGMKRIKKRKILRNLSGDSYQYPDDYEELADREDDIKSSTSCSSSSDSQNDENVEPAGIAISENERRLNTFRRPDGITTKAQTNEYEIQKKMTINLFNRLVEEENTRGQFSSTNQPKDLTLELMPHQIRGLWFMVWRETLANPGGIIADEMGEFLLNR